MKKLTLLSGFLLVLLITVRAQVVTELIETLPKPDTILAGEYYGRSISVSGSYAVIGSYGYKSYTGRALVLYNTGSSWEKVAELTASDGEENDNFSISVDIYGDYIVIGANGDDDNGSSSGSAYVFQKPTTGWEDMTETAKLTASDANYYDYFGNSVSISDTTIVIGANGDDDNGSSSGSVYVFVKPATGWTDMTETAKLTTSDGVSGDYLGYSVDISENTIIAGAYYKSDSGYCSGSAYVFEKPSTGWVDDTTETAKLIASDEVEYDYFGYSVSISGSTVVVGSYGDDDNGSSSGSAYVFEKPTSGWANMVETAKLTASDGEYYDYFGYSVSISDSVIVVGAHRKDNDYVYSSGSVYVFEKPTTGWANITESAMLNASDKEDYDYLGCAVSISGNTIVAGAYGDDDNGTDAGSAYLFEKSSDDWSGSEEAYKTTAPVYLNSKSNLYGYSVAMDGDYAVVGAYGYNSNTGNAYVLHKNGSEWEQVAVLKASDGDADYFFGYSVSISGSTIVIGCYGDDDNGYSSGSVYIYEKPEQGWIDTTETAKLLPSDGAFYDYFGYSVSISGSTIVVGSLYDDENGSSSGSAYVFEKPEGSWTDTTETAKLAASDGSSYSYFGSSVSISNNTIVIGEPYEDVNGDDDIGSAYVFEKPEEGWTDTTETAKLTASEGEEYGYFGNSVSISGNTIVIGAYGTSDNGYSSGAAYLYEKPEKGWTDTTETAKLLPSDGDYYDNFAYSVDISDSIVVIGARYGEGEDYTSGAAYIFIKPSTGWVDTIEIAKIAASDGEYYDNYGCTVGVSGNYIVVGAPYNDNEGSSAGSAYFYDISYPIKSLSEISAISGVCTGTGNSLVVNGSNIVTYQWQMSSDNGASFTDLGNTSIFAGADSSTLVITADTSVNNNYFRCIVTNTAFGDTTNTALFSLENTLPTFSCVSSNEVTISSTEGYTVVGSEFDPTDVADNCDVDFITNDFNNDSTLAEALLPVGTTNIVWSVVDKAGNVATFNSSITVASTGMNNGFDADAAVNYTLFPNPTTGVVNISLANSEGAELIIYGITGEAVYYNTSFSGGSIDLSKLNAGMYIVQLTTNGKTSISKLMKK